MKANDGLDSQSFLGILLGEQETQSKIGTSGAGQQRGILQPTVQKHFHGENQWKLIATKELEPIELYDLASDPTESRNRIKKSAQSERVERMRANLQSVFRSKRSTKPYRLNGKDD